MLITVQKLKLLIKESSDGQSLIEILIAISIAAIVIGASVYGISFMFSSMTFNEQRQTATSLAEDLMNKVQSIADANWLDIYNLPHKGATSTYYVVASGSLLAVTGGIESITINNVNYNLYFSIENVNRDASDNIVTSGGINDPSTQKVTVTVEWSASGSNVSRFQISDYLTRWKNRVIIQNDWSGGAGAEGPFTEPNNKFASSSPNIDTTSTPGIIKLRF